MDTQEIREITGHIAESNGAMRRASDAMRLAEAELTRLRSLCDSYRSMNGRLERLLGELHTRFQNKAARDELLLWDEMADMVRNEHLAIHGPSD